MSTPPAGPARFDPFTSCGRCRGLGRMAGNAGYPHYDRCSDCNGTGVQQPPWVGAGQ